jgi:Flp pilus assembly protein TadG
MSAIDRRSATFGQPRRQRGAVAIIVALSLVVMVGFMGLAIDGGRLDLTKTELQNAADACALAAAYELTGNTISAEAFQRAEAAGRLVAQQNRTDFQSTPVAASQVSVEYNSVLTGGSWVTAAGTPSGSSKYVRCVIQRTGIAPYFMQALGIGDQTVTSLATATLAPAQSNCAVPMGLCVVGGGTAPNFGYTQGNWYGLDFQDTGGAANYTGNFRWIDFDPSNPTPGCSGAGAQELSCVMAGAGQCSLPAPITGSCASSGSASPTPGCVGQNGNVASMETSYNSRFGVYRNGAGNPQKTTAAPDITGQSYAWEGGVGNWSLGRDAYSGTSGTTPNFVAARASRLPTENIAGLNPAFYANPYNPSTSADHVAYGADRRLVTAPIVDCAGFTSGQHAPIRGYACILLLDPYRTQGSDVRSKFEYLGRSNVAGSPCATSGIAGNTSSQGPMVPALVQ